MTWFAKIRDRENNMKNTKTAQVANELGNREEVVLFPSKRIYESTYSCFVVLNKMEDESYHTCVYMTETYLGRNVMSHNCYFKTREAASSCFNRCLEVVRNTKREFAASSRKQAEISHYLKIQLQGEKGDIKPHINQISNYLDRDNVVKRTDLASDNILYIPSERPISKDLPDNETSDK